MKKIFLIIAAGFLSFSVSAQFTPGNIVVVKTSGSVSKAGSAISLLEYSTSGSAGTTVALPSTGGAALQMAAGSGGSEGFLSRSSDGSFLVLGAYNTSTSYPADITVSTSSAAPRALVKIDPSGTTTQFASSATFYNANDIRGGISDGTNFWASGGSVNSVDGIDYYGPGSMVALGTHASTPVKAYGLQIFNGQIYYSTQKVGPSNTASQLGIFALGSGLPTSGSPASTQIINTGSVVPADFSFNSAMTICYIAIPLNTAAGGIQKWTKSGSVWSLAYTLGTGVSSIGAYGLTVDYSGTNPVLYATTFEANTVGNRVIKITDSGSGSTATTLATNAANNWYHGIAFAPCSAPVISSVTNNGPICSDATLNLSVSVTGATPLTYAWTGTGTFSSTTVSNPSVTGATSGNYSVSVTNGCGFTASSSTAAVVNAVTTPSVSIAANPGTTICSGTNVTFTAAPTNGGTTPSYQWTLNGNAAGTNSNSYSNNSLSNGDQVACVLTSNQVCVSIATANSNVVTINVTSSVVPSLSIASATGNTNCEGTNVVFTATPTNGGATPAYVWKLNGNIVGTNSGTYSNNTLSNQDSVVCLLTSSTGCASPSNATSNTLHLTVNPSLTPSVSISPAPNDTICAGTNVTFTANALNGGSTSYQWTKRGVNVGSNSATYSSTSFLNNDSIICTITSTATCRTFNTASSSAVVLNVNPTPTPTITGTLNYCTGGSTILDAGAGYASYLWSNSAASQTISPVAGTYSVTVSNGICTGTSPLVTVVVDNILGQPAAFTTSSSSISAGQIGIAYSVPSSPSATSYTWSYSGTGATINGTSNSVTVDFSNAATAGTLSVTANNTCGASNSRSMAIAINAALRITEFMYSGINGEFVEFTNVGASDIDLTGWSWSDNIRTPGSHDLSSIGIIKAGQSVISTEASPSTFRTAWNLCSAIKIVGPYSTDNLGRADEINLYNGSNLVDRLTYNDQLAGNVARTQNKSAWVSLAGLGNNLPAQWTLSAVSDGETSFTSTGGDIASPGKSTRATVAYTHCFVPNGLPSIVVNTALTTNYLDGAATSVFSPLGISGVLIDPTDPAKNLGIHFTISDTETDTNSLVVTVASSNITVVPNANIILTGSGANRNVKITPANVGYANITVTVNDGTNNTVFVLAYAASVSAEEPSAASWHTGMSDGSDAVALDSAYYISGDDELNQLNVYSRYASGLPAKIFTYTSYLALPDPAKPEVDLEAGTRSMKNTNKLFWLGSMSNGKAPFDSKPNRNRIFSTTVAGTGAATNFTFSGYYGDLKNQILTWGDTHGYNFTASAAAGVDSKSISGFAAEGMVFGPDSTTLFIAFRAPLVPTSTRTKAVIAPVLNFETWFNNGSPAGAPTFGAPIELDLGGRGFRDLIRLPNGTYIIVAGSASTDGNSGLYKWTGYAVDAPVAIFSALNGAINMEGAMPIGTALNQIQIVCDGGDDFLYGDATAAKDFADLGMRKFKSTVLSGVNLDICAGFAASNIASGSATFCAGDSVTLSSNNNCSYLWSNGKTTQSIVVKRPGNYTVTSVNPRSNCSALSAPTNVNVNLMGDTNRNGVVNITDFSIFLAKFSNTCSDCVEDIDGNGVVNISDFSLFLSQYGQTCN